MSTLVCLYVIGITALVASAAAAIEWAVQGRIATRHLWSAAVFVAVVLPPLSIVEHARGAPHVNASPTRTALIEMVQLGHVASAGISAREPRTPLNTLRIEYHAVLDRASHLSARTILALWIAASLALVAWIAAGAAHWHRARREWQETELDGVSVHLSAETGPAVLGVVAQRIVLPAWVCTLAPEYRRLMLAHECEHIAARDPQRLAVALGALVLMPWNPALWWCAARMRRAIELDCDARVLRRFPAPRAYSHLLLQVAARGNNTGPLAVPLVNLLRLPSELEMRLRAMTRPRTVVRRTAWVGAAGALAAVSVAFTAPVPSTTRATIRNLAQATRARLSHGERAVVRVGNAVLRLDSATVNAKSGTVQGHLRELRILPPSATSADTIPSAVAEDSMERMARQLAAQTGRLDSLRVRADSLDAEVQMMRAHAEALDTANLRERARLDSAARDPNGKQQRALRRMEAALAKYYPGVSLRTVSASGAIWFLADSHGNVVETKRVAYGRGIGFPAPNVNSKDVDFVTVRSTTPGRLPHFSVLWMQLRR